MALLHQWYTSWCRKAKPNPSKPKGSWETVAALWGLCELNITIRLSEIPQVVIWSYTQRKSWFKQPFEERLTVLSNPDCSKYNIELLCVHGRGTERCIRSLITFHSLETAGRSYSNNMIHFRNELLKISSFHRVRCINSNRLQGEN